MDARDDGAGQRVPKDRDGGEDAESGKVLQEPAASRTCQGEQRDKAKKPRPPVYHRKRGYERQEQRPEHPAPVWPQHCAPAVAVGVGKADQHGNRKGQKCRKGQGGPPFRIDVRRGGLHPAQPRRHQRGGQGQGQPRHQRPRKPWPVVHSGHPFPNPPTLSCPFRPDKSGKPSLLPRCGLFGLQACSAPWVRCMSCYGPFRPAPGGASPPGPPESISKGANPQAWRHHFKRLRQPANPSPTRVVRAGGVLTLGQDS